MHPIDTFPAILFGLSIAFAVALVYLLVKYGPRRLVGAVRWRVREVIAGKYWGRERPAQHYDSKYSQPYDTSRYEPIYAQVLQWVDGLKNPTILEVGCGTGVLAKRLLARGVPYHGFDFSGVAVEQARERSGKDVFKRADAYDPSSYDHDFDAVILLEVLEHLDDFRVLQNIPAGVMVVGSVPNYRDPGHVRIYKSESAIRQRYGGHIAIDEVIEYHVGGKSKLFLFRGTRLANG